MHNFSLIGSGIRELRYPHFPISYKQRSWPLQTVIACAILWCYTEPVAPETIWKWRDRNFFDVPVHFSLVPLQVREYNNKIIGWTRPRGESFTSSLTMMCNITVLLIFLTLDAGNSIRVSVRMIQEAQLSQRGRACFVLLNISPSHLRSHLKWHS